MKGGVSETPVPSLSVCAIERNSSIFRARGGNQSEDNGHTHATHSHGATTIGKSVAFRCMSKEGV